MHFIIIVWIHIGLPIKARKLVKDVVVLIRSWTTLFVCLLMNLT